ncbi:hypothetical protein D0463_08240 [Bacillus sp. V59.32b]|nr:hypothetical protein D0463_08240 [Bacillus sp. V59.32b]
MEPLSMMEPLSKEKRMNVRFLLVCFRGYVVECVYESQRNGYKYIDTGKEGPEKILLLLIEIQLYCKDNGRFAE